MPESISSSSSHPSACLATAGPRTYRIRTSWSSMTTESANLSSDGSGTLHLPRWNGCSENELAGVPLLQLPTDRPREGQKNIGKSWSFVLLEREELVGRRPCERLSAGEDPHHREGHVDEDRPAGEEVGRRQEVLEAQLPRELRAQQAGNGRPFPTSSW